MPETADESHECGAYRCCFAYGIVLHTLATGLTLVSTMAAQNAARARLARMTASVLAFASGCAAAALFYARIGTYCFLIPPLLGLGTLAFRMAAHEGDVQ